MALSNNKPRLSFIIFSFFVILTSCSTEELYNKSFPEGFLFGTSTSSYQVEGGWNDDGKGESVWDATFHAHPDLVIDRSNGDIACDSYHKYEEDILLLKQLGVDVYRFSISWPRILPTGLVNNINEAGVNYYKNLIAGLKEANIEPLVVIFHHEFPQALNYLGDFNNEVVVEYFTEYANLLFQLFGNDVKYWITVNEPQFFCQVYVSTFAQQPYFNIPLGITEYLCGHNLLLAHAKVYHLYEKRYKPKQKGQVSISINFSWFEPASNSEKDRLATNRMIQFQSGWFANPIYNGDYPDVMRKRICERSRQEGLPKCRLPFFTAEEKKMLNGSYDFFALNHYVTNLAEWLPDGPNNTMMSFENDTNVKTSTNSSWPSTALGTSIVPWGFRKVLNYIKDNYNDPEIIVTENGYNNRGGQNDTDRINYIQLYLSEALKAIYEDGVKLRGYTVWSLMDDFEWTNGYQYKFGLYDVDFNSTNRTRTPKQSVNFYRNLIKTKCFVDECD